MFYLSRLDDALMCLVGDWCLSLLFIKELCLNLFLSFFFFFVKDAVCNIWRDCLAKA